MSSEAVQKFRLSGCVLFFFFLPSCSIAMSDRGDRVQNHLVRSVDGESLSHGTSSPIISPGMVGANTFPDWASRPHEELKNSVLISSASPTCHVTKGGLA